MVPKCRTLTEIKPPSRRCWAHGGPYGHVPRIKGLGGPGVEPRGLHKILINQPKSQTQGATWQPFIGPRGTLPFAKNATCHNVTRPVVNQSQLPRHLPRHHHLPRHLYGRHVSCTASATSAVRPAQSASFFFTCLARRTDRDNFSIRTPFAKVNIPPESGERDGRNGTIFVAFRAL
jgi:hypothetical protein